MKKSPRQLILIIVEGKSEIDALEYPLNSLYEKYGYDVEIRFPVLDSDKDLSLRGGRHHFGAKCHSEKHS